MKFKRFLSGVLAAAVALSTMALTPFATASAVDVVATGSCGENATWTLDSEFLLTISGTGTITGFEEGFFNKYWVKAIHIEDGITDIGDKALGSHAERNGGHLSVITLPKTLKTLGESAVSQWTGIRNLKIPSGVTSIGDSCFYDLRELESINIPDSVTEIGPAAFRACSKLKTVTIGKGVTKLGDSTFGYCSSATDYYIYARDIASVVASDNVYDAATFGNNTMNPVFHVYEGSTTEKTLKDNGYTNIAYITPEEEPTTEEPTTEFPVGGKEGKCGENVTWSFDEATGTLTLSGEGNMYDYDMSTKFSWQFDQYKDQIKKVIVGKDVSSIGRAAFKGSAVEHIEFEAEDLPGDFYIGFEAFADCAKLEELDFSNIGIGGKFGRGYIDKRAFENCTSLKYVVLPLDDIDVDSYAFFGCTSLETVVAPESLEINNSRTLDTIHRGVMGGTFKNCPKLKSVYLLYGDYFCWTTRDKEGDTSDGSGIYAYHFDDSEDLTFYHRYYYERTTQKPFKSFLEERCPNIKNAKIVGLPTATEQYRLQKQVEKADKKLKEFADADLEVDPELLAAFQPLYDKAKTELSLGAIYYSVDSTIDIGASIKEGKLPTMTGPEVVQLTSDLKAATDALKSVNVIKTGKCGENVTWSLNRETGILTISGTGPMNETVYTNCTPWTYYEYANDIKEVVIEEGVTSVGACAFGHVSASDTATVAYPNLKKITLPATIETIGKGAFYSTVITNLTVPKNVKRINSFAYSYSMIKDVEIPEGAFISANAFSHCDYLQEATCGANITYGHGGDSWGGETHSESIFFECTALKKATILGCGTVQQRYATVENGLPNTMFNGCTALNEVIIKCDDLAYVGKAGNNYTETFETNGTNITYTVIKGSTTETTLRNAGYLTDTNVVYSLDFTELNAKLAEAEAIKAENYSAKSYAALATAIGTAKTVKENANAAQADIDAAVKAITDAIDGLVEADSTKMKAALEKFSGNIEKLLTIKNESDYTSDSWTALNDALKAAKDALASEKELTYNEYEALYDNLNDAYSGLTIVNTSDKYVATIYGGYEVTYNHETDSYKVVVSDDVDMEKVVGTSYVKVTCTPNEALKYQLAYGTLHIWNFLDGDQPYKSLKGSEDNVFKYNLSIPTTESAFSLTAGTGWTKSDEVFYVKNVEFYNENDELLYTYSAGSIGVGDVRNLKDAIEKAQAIDKSMCTEESLALLALVIEDANATLNDPSATKDDYRVRTSELEAAIAAIEYLPADYTKVNEAKAKVPADLSGYIEETVNVLNEALNSVVEGKNITEQETVDAWAKAIEDAIAGLELKPIGGDLTGTIYVSDEESGTEMTVAVTVFDGTVVRSVTASSMGTYTIECLETGRYTIIVSGGKYAPRTYEITVEAGGSTQQDVKLNPYGDINGDGKVTTADVGRANSHAKGVITLTDYDFVCADVKTDGSITTADVGMINSHAKAVKSLW